MTEQLGEFFLFLGNSHSESATTRVRAGGGHYQIKRLNSGPENWRKITELASSPRNQGTVATFTGNDYVLMVSSTHSVVAEQLLDALVNRPHAIFVHAAVYLTPDQRVQIRPDREPENKVNVEVNDRFDDEFYFGIFREEFFGEIPQEVRERVNTMMSDRGLNVLPYETNVERSILATAFLDDHERNLLFRVYVPSGRLFATEAGTLVRLFQDWLNTTGQGDIRLDSYRTRAGQVFEFFSAIPRPGSGLSDQFRNFSDFLDRCVDFPESAASELAAVGVDSSGANLVVARFATAAKRLRLDLEQRREERLLVLKHSLETTMLEVEGLSGDSLMSALETLLPRGASPMLAIQGPAGGPLESGVAEAASQLSQALARDAGQVYGVNVQFSQQIIEHVAGSVVQNVQGTVNLSPEAKDLLELVARFGGVDRVGLESAVHELEDDGARAPERIEARQKLKRFLADLGSKGLGFGLATLQKYVEHQIGVS